MTTRRVVVTGACGGIGAATVDAFTAAGWQVIGVDAAAPADDLAVERFVRVDLASADAMSIIAAALADVAGLDALINNAAIQVNQPLVTTSDAEWSRVLDTNLTAAFRLIRTLHPALSERRGAIVNVSSVHAVATSANVAAYAVSKGALVALTRTAAIELAPDGIRCNAVLPGAVHTPMLAEGLSRRPHERGPDGNLEELRARTPLGFVARPAQIAPSILHLADNDASPYTTGQTLVVDGGASVHLRTE